MPKVIYALLRAPSAATGRDPERPKPLPKVPKQPGPSPDSNINTPACPECGKTHKASTPCTSRRALADLLLGATA